MSTVPTRRPRAGTIVIDPRVEKMPDDFLECRLGNHVFPFSKTRRQKVREANRNGRGSIDTVHLTATCTRCESVRITVRDLQTFEKLRVWYEYADGYSNPDVGGGQIPRSVVGLELLRRYPPTE